MLDRPLAVLFDFDGVIANSEPLHYRCFREVAAQHDINLSPQQYYSSLIGFDDRGAWRQIFKLHRREREIDETLLEILLAKKTRVIHELIARKEFGALPGVEELINYFHRMKTPLAIYSGARRVELEPMLDGLKLREFFSIITTAEDVKVGKPDPSGYILTAARLSKKIGWPLPHERCLVIEDAPNVAIRVRGEGFNVLGVTSSAPDDAWPTEITRVATLEKANLLNAKVIESW